MRDPFAAPAAALGAAPASRRPIWALVGAVFCALMGIALLLEFGGFMVEHGHRYRSALAGRRALGPYDRAILAEHLGVLACGVLACGSGWAFWANRRLVALVLILGVLVALTLSAWVGTW